ncbi:lysophosphatidic acid receptor 5b [Danio rerio]|uniref:Lysophosphatidic acid receptor 5b n=1 Tax=Danio rerio TaxID=7955 RepID=B3DHI5_DANRE|nr:lysophosphatidic acid receptor 5b [Danio rerio]AAI62776.1 Similar to purinergic receptor P2Y, G-protein coupled, 5 [Danio rerio]AAI62782.1 Similar to purinergic receptor P2Y, G-protein coupled, 5 [Danio rerio]|eukprot:NP_001122269.1 lysophosphatidic acid receptor 5b [Danio rerio]
MNQNFTNTCITNQLEPSARFVASAVVYGLVLVIGLPLNTVSLWILLRSHGLRSPCAVLMVNLAASDLLLALSLPLRVYFYATLQWPLGAVSCAGAIMLFRINIRTSSIFITLISLDRMVALVFPLRSRSLRTSACALKSCALVWILITILSIPETLKIHGSLKNCAHMPCFEFQVQQNASQTPSILQALFLLILLVVNVVSTVVVVVVLQRRPNAGATKVNNKMNVVLIFLVNMLVFTVFFLPFTLQLLAYKKDDFDRKVLRSLICLASVNCCLDPLIYYFSLDSFWQDKGKKQTDAGTYSLSRSMDRS